MSTVTYLVQLKKPTKYKHKLWLEQQREYANCINWCSEQILNGEKLSSKNTPFKLKSAIKNEAIRRAKKGVQDYKKGDAKKLPYFRSTTPISVNNQNWSTLYKNNRWYVGFTTNEGKKYLPVVETDWVKTYFHYFQKREFRGTAQLVRKGAKWYVAIPVELSCPTKSNNSIHDFKDRTPIGVDLGLRHIAVISEPNSNKRQFFSGKEVGYVRRHFRSLRRSLQQKKALRAVKRIGQKETRWIENYNRQLAKDIVDFALQFEKPIIKLEQLEDIRNTCKTMKRADKTIHSWAFYQLKQFIKERASKFDIPVVDINPYKTSQRCYQCGHTDRLNRNRDKFHCKNCGEKCHADLNASRNIAISTDLAV